MVAWYKHDIPAWMDGTEGLSDGAYRAYHVICQLIYLNEGPIAPNEHGIAGRCRQSIRAFRKHLAELLQTGKLRLENGRLANSRADKELEKVGDNRMNAAKGGENSGKVRKSPPKPLENNNTDEAALPEDRSLKTRLDKTRADVSAAKPPDEIGKAAVAIIKAFEDANSPNLPDTSRVEMWKAQGYDLKLCVATVRDGIKRKPSVSTLAYFDGAITDAHAKRNPTPVVEVEPDWDSWCAKYAAGGPWPRALGPEPGYAGCRVPPEILERHGIDPKTGMPKTLRRVG